MLENQVYKCSTDR